MCLSGVNEVGVWGRQMLERVGAQGGAGDVGGGGWASVRAIMMQQVATTDKWRRLMRNRVLCGSRAGGGYGPVSGWTSVIAAGTQLFGTTGK